MNVDLQYSMDFLGAVWHDGALQLNSYSIGLQMLTASHANIVTNVAVERIRAFVQGELCNVVFINQIYENEAEMLQALGCNICTLPIDPVDQAVGIMLYCKLNAITENNLLITQLDISSSLGDEVWYQHHSENPIGPFAQDGWWHNRTCQKHSLATDTDPNIVKLQVSGWTEYGLEWPELEPVHTTKIVTTDFKRNENK